MTRWGGLTPRGFGFVTMGVLLLVTAWGFRRDELLLPAFGAILAPLLALLITWATAPRLRVSRTVHPPLLPAGTDLAIDLTLANTSLPWGTQVTATDRLPGGFGGAYSFELPAQLRGQSTQHRAVVQPRRRGRFTLDGLEYATSDPLGLATRIVRISAPAQVAVTPMLIELPPTALRAAGTEGETPIPQSSITGPDDVMVREYQPRDDVRRIHWPLTARTGELMVRREEQSWDPTAWILLDSRIHDGSRSAEVAFEWMVSLTASWGVRLAEDGFELHLTNAVGNTYTAVGGTPQSRATSWLEYLVDVDTSGHDSLAGGAATIARAHAGHVLLAIVGRLDLSTAKQLTAAEDGTTACHALVLPPDTQQADDHNRGVAHLASHGWVIQQVPVGTGPENWTHP